MAVLEITLVESINIPLPLMYRPSQLDHSFAIEEHEEFAAALAQEICIAIHIRVCAEVVLKVHRDGIVCFHVGPPKLPSDNLPSSE